MEQRALVERARAGDSAAFTVLARRYHEMVLGYALAIVRDFYLAQDVTQEALFVAYGTLSTLEDTARFPAWLRGIVRFQCSRVLRQRRLDLAPLADQRRLFRERWTALMTELMAAEVTT